MKRLCSLLILLIIYFIPAAQEIPKWKIEQLEAYITNAEKPVIINFWATFCKPCIEEIPYFQKQVSKYKSFGVELLLVSLDLPDDYKNIKNFVSKKKVLAPIVYLDETNADVFCPKIDKNWSGAIPATLFLNPRTRYRAFFEDQLSERKLEDQIKTLLNH
jgi:thiol-disulfide isomerase/thioredoxin